MTTTTTTSVSLESLPVTVITPPDGRARLNLRELWDYREILYLLVWRDIKILYKQTAIGVGWAILQPILSTAVFSVLFGRIVGLPSNGVPYPLFAYCALAPWTYLTHVLPRATYSLVNNYSILTKVYFPRALIPLTPIIAGLIDLAIAMLVLLVLLVVYSVIPTAAVLTLPLWLGLLIALSFGAGLWLSALNIEYRDVGNIVPFMFQVWLFITPVFYSSQLIPEPWRIVYSLNPMVGIVEGFRWALLGTTQPLPVLECTVSSFMVVVILITGLLFFRRREEAFADIV